MGLLLNIAERGYAPDPAIRFGIRQLLKMRLREILNSNDNEIINSLRTQPIALATNEANAQHYELPTQFFEFALGSNLKYSSAFYELGAKDLSEAEAHMLGLYLERADIQDGQRILDMGCGWGSLSLWIAKRYPNCKILSVSNSKVQKKFIEQKAATLGVDNLQIITADMNIFNTEERFDRIVSIEMFEHMRNYEQLFNKISTWLKSDGKLFVHIFCHKDTTYFFETKGDHNWMGRYFFTGGIMPSYDLYEKVQDNFSLVQKWAVNGTNYQKTSEAWLDNMDRNKDQIMEIMKSTYGESNAMIWLQRWRIFFASCAELFGFDNGNEWFVGHYLFEHNKTHEPLK